MKKYFRLYEEVYFVKGDVESCIHDLFTGQVIKISRKEAAIIEYAEQNYALEHIADMLKINHNDMESVLEKLENAKMGGYFDSCTYIEKVTLLPNWKDKTFFKLPPEIHRAFIELNDVCDSSCFFCDNKEYVVRFQCLSCSKNNSTRKLSTENIKEYLEQLCYLGVKQIYLTGGNVFLDTDKLAEIISYSKQLGFYEIVIISGNVNYEYVAKLGELARHVKFIFQRYVDLDYRQQIKSDMVLQYTQKEKLKGTFLYLLKYENKYLIEEILDFLKQEEIQEDIFFDYLININQISDEQLVEMKYLKNNISMMEFSIKKKYNTCFKSTISISGDGVITTCPVLKGYDLSESGDLQEAVTSKNMRYLSRLSLDNIEGCTTCGYKYLCNDCRYLEQYIHNNIMTTKLCVLRK